MLQGVNSSQTRIRNRILILQCENSRKTRIRNRILMLQSAIVARQGLSGIGYRYYRV